jgi:4-alpha-glucanotransferase
VRGLPDRAAGILLHPTSLPGGEGVGTMGRAAFSFLEFCAASGFRIWQICPLGPTGYGDSPYQCLSARAGNPLLIDLEGIARRGWLRAEEVPADSATARIDYGGVIPRKAALLARAHAAFSASARKRDAESLAEWASGESGWLEEYCLFAALKRRFALKAWTDWPLPYREGEADALARARSELAEDISLERFVQWNFASQWEELRTRAGELGVSLMGDMPIYVAHDSVESWSRRPLFRLDAEGAPLEVSGVPPDYFSPEGQLWGNPIWDWKAMAALAYAPWVAIIRSQLDRFDILRIDHFRGFSEYWAVPPGEKTAIPGRWKRGPGMAPFEALAAAIGGEGPLPIIAEDLGDLGGRAKRLRRRSGFPGMKILQFAFDSKEKGNHLPGGGDVDYAIYTGTHDNDTVAGWFASAREEDRDAALKYLGVPVADAPSAESIPDLPWLFIRAALDSPCRIAIVPAQDILGLGSDARMNKPGTAEGNWRWRLREGQLGEAEALRLREMIVRTGRA